MAALAFAASAAPVAAFADDPSPPSARPPPSPVLRDVGAGLWAGGVSGVAVGLGLFVWGANNTTRVGAALATATVSGVVGLVGSALFAAGQSRLDTFAALEAGDAPPGPALRNTGAVLTAVGGGALLVGSALLPYLGRLACTTSNPPSCTGAPDGWVGPVVLQSIGGLALSIGLPLLAAGQAELDVADDWNEGQASARLCIGIGIGSLGLSGSF